MELETWIDHFARNGRNRPAPPWDTQHRALDARTKAALLSSLQQFKVCFDLCGIIGQCLAIQIVSLLGQDTDKKWDISKVNVTIPVDVSFELHRTSLQSSNECWDVTKVNSTV